MNIQLMFAALGLFSLAQAPRGSHATSIQSLYAPTSAQNVQFLRPMMADEDPILIGATLQFRTNDDDKDNDTAVSASLSHSGRNVASVDNIVGNRFPDQTDNGPFAMRVLGTNHQGDLQHGTLHVHIAPNGHDTWKFNVTLTLRFLDGSENTYSWSGIRLDQDSTDIDLSY